MLFSRKDKKEIKEIKHMMDMPEPYEEPVIEPASVEREIGAPLFIKVDKYRDIIKSVQEIKLFVASTKQVFTILHDAESLRADTLNVLRATIQRVERSILEIDTELVRPHGISLPESGEAMHIESSLNELQKQLIELKKELGGMK